MREEIIRVLRKAVGKEDVYLETPENEEYGDYSSNIAMQIFSKNEKRKTKNETNLKLQISKFKNPRELAEEIIKKLVVDRSLKAVVDRIEVAGPGFINFWLKKDVLFNSLIQIDSLEDRYGSSETGKGKTALIEYSSPNIAKKFSIGHLRSTIIGQSIRNIYEFLGYKTIGENHLGDWGTQFGMIIAQVVRKNIRLENLRVADYQKLYLEFNKEMKNLPKLRDEAKYWFRQLEKGDEKAKAIWSKAVETSLREFEKIYDYLDVDIENSHGESFYEDKMQEIIDEAKNKGLSKKSQGAEVIKLDGMPPAILLKSDGGTTYFTRDLAALKYRIKTWNPDIIIYEVGVEQTLHFKQVFAAAKALGWIENEKLVHIGHGLFRFEGKKMATRKGTDVDLESVLEEAVKRAREVIEKSETGRKMSRDEKKKVSEKVGIGAIKYYDLMHNPKSNIDFAWDDVVLLEGNSGPYLQYTYARAQSVLEKAQSSRHEAQNKSQITNSNNKKVSNLENLDLDIVSDFEIRFSDLNDEEMKLLRSFIHFPEVVRESAEKYSPNLICNYLFDLAQKYNAFYNAHRILVEDRLKLELRLRLTFATGQILKNGLNLLGIQTPERM